MGDWHRREIAEVFRELRTDPGPGLTGAEAVSRLRAKYVVGLALGRLRE